MRNWAVNEAGLYLNRHFILLSVGATFHDRSAVTQVRKMKNKGRGEADGPFFLCREKKRQ